MCSSVEIKLPVGLYHKLEEVLTAERAWPSRRDFVIDAVREELVRLKSTPLLERVQSKL